MSGSGSTDHYDFPYPIASDAAVIASDIQNLAVSVDSQIYTIDAGITQFESDVTNQIAATKTNSRYTTSNIAANANDIILCDSSSNIVVTLPPAPAEDDVVRIYNNGNGSVTVTANNDIQGSSSITSSNSGIFATFTNGSWWCLPLSSRSGAGGYTDPAAWTRPNNWIPQPVVNQNTNRVYALVHVDQGKTLSIGFTLILRHTNAGSPQFNIDWGDGSTQTFTGTNNGSVTFYHTYNYSSMSLDYQMTNYALTRQAQIIIEPVDSSTKITQISSFYNDPSYQLKKGMKELIIALPYLEQLGYMPTCLQNFVIHISNNYYNTYLRYMFDESSDIRRAEMYFYNSVSPDMYRAFQGAPKIDSIYLYGSATGVYAYDMCGYCYNLSYAYISPSLIFQNSSYMFEYTAFTVPPQININAISTDFGSYMFYGGSLMSIDGFRLSNTPYSPSYLFEYNYGLKSAKNVNISGNAGGGGHFYYCSALREVDGINVSSFYINSSAESLFSRCYSLISVKNLNTSGVKNVSYMFSQCYALPSIDSTVDISSATNANSMFNNCYSLEYIPSLIGTSNLQNVANMFSYCYSLKTIPSMNLSSVTSAGNFAYNCSNLESSGVYGIKVAHTYGYCNLDANALNTIYTNLGIPGAVPTKQIASAYANYYQTYYTTAQPHGFNSGDYVTITGFSQSQFNASNYYVYYQNATQFYIYNYPYNYVTATGTLGSAVNANSAPIITVTGNPGTATDNPTIAINKGWTVIG